LQLDILNTEITKKMSLKNLNKEDIIFILNNYETNLDETVGLYISDKGQLCEDLRDGHSLIQGLHHSIILEQGCYGLFFLDWAYETIVDD